MRRFNRKLLEPVLLVALMAAGCGAGSSPQSVSSKPAAAPAPQASSPHRVVADSVGQPVTLAPVIHTVVAGEHLSTIASQYQVDWKRLFDANPTLTFADGHTEAFNNQDALPVGATLRIPYFWETFAPRPLYVAPPVVIKTKLVSYQTASASSPAAAGEPSDADFDLLSGCESSHNWQLVDGLYRGGLQFDNPTWESNGGKAYAATADQASREDQITVARRLWRARGWKPWPVCSKQVGLA